VALDISVPEEQS